MLQHASVPPPLAPAARSHARPEAWKRSPQPSHSALSDPPQTWARPQAFCSQVFHLLEKSRVRFGRPGLGLPLQILQGTGTERAHSEHNRGKAKAFNLRPCVASREARLEIFADATEEPIDWLSCWHLLRFPVGGLVAPRQRKAVPRAQHNLNASSRHCSR